MFIFSIFDNNLNMKKFIALVLVGVALLLIKSPFSLSNVSNCYSGTYTFYTQEKFSDYDTQCMQSGNGFLVSTSNKNANDVFLKLNLNMLQGESFCFDGNMLDAQVLIKKLNGKVLKTEKVGDMLIFYGQSGKLEKYVVVDNEKINFQVAVNDGKVTIGTPLILGGY